MEKIYYEEVDTTPLSIVKKAVYISEDLGNVKSFQGIIDKYKEYRFEEHLENIRGEFECQSYSYILFTIHLETTDTNLNTYFPLFSAILEIPNSNEIEYNISYIFNDEGRNDEILLNKLLKNELFKKIYIKAEMETKFFIYRSLNILNEYEAEQIEDLYDEGDDNEVNELTPAIIESCFIYDNCTICLSTPPNILLFPCLHLATCEKCEENGKLIKCSVCRETIERKIKI